MEKVKHIVIGFGKAGKTLAMELGNKGEEVLVIEKDPKMYGGTCINVACIPTKFLINLANSKPEDAGKNIYYTESVRKKKELIAKLNTANYNNVNNTPNVRVVDGTASFIDEHTVRVDNNGVLSEFEAENIYVNTGSRPNIPNIEGLSIGGNIHTSETILNLEELPNHLAIIGAGNIGLEFASMFRQFGSEVTVISHSDKSKFLDQYDEDIANSVLNVLEEMGIKFLFEANTTQVEEVSGLKITYDTNGTTSSITADALLVSTGRHANTQQLNLENAGVEVDKKGAIPVNKHLQSNVKHIFALGDVNGGPQFTYISLDDYRIASSFLHNGGLYSLDERANVPSTMFINPPLAGVGINEKEAKRAGLNYKVKTTEVSSIMMSKVLGQQEGLFKILIDVDSDKILGATLFGVDSHELINLIAVAMTGQMKAADLKTQVYIHPSMSESLNNIL